MIPMSFVRTYTDQFDYVDDPSPEDLDGEKWQERSLCAQTDPELFFPEKGGSTREAQRICAACPVRAECLEYALLHDERFGVWGGLSEQKRRTLRRDKPDAVAVDELPPTSKFCRSCDTARPLDVFQKDQSKPDGLQAYCRDCRNKHERSARHTRQRAA